MMNDEPRDASLLIGLHKLAAQNGEGLVPELYALLSARSEAAPDMTNVVPLPATGSKAQASSLPPGQSAKVLSFGR
jgi:hypothetical protein